MFTIANPFFHQTALGSNSNSLLSQNPQVRHATDFSPPRLQRVFCIVSKSAGSTCYGFVG
ncbi:MAG: hypothetical protein V7L29_34270 [Nostoc sp.]|uniref:hypothetical protein n=1 Tax=Nostoc sp. TaxID=1180 RepID=UPI002FF559FC